MSASVVANLTVQFGKNQLPLSQIFILRKNPSCPGHVLVASRRPVKRLHELTEVETLDLWTTVQQVSRVMEQIHKFPCQIGVQDGTDAGQTIDHVHIHIIPFPKDYSQDVIMDSEGSQLIIETIKFIQYFYVERPPRTADDMAKEADKYRTYFEQGSNQQY